MYRAVALLLFANGLALGAEPTWGDAVDGIRLGLTAQGTTLHVIYENVGSTMKEILIGARANEAMYPVKFHARHSNGKTCEALNLAGATSVGGYLSPIVVPIAAGKTHDLALPMGKLICVENRIDIPLNVLLDHGYSVRATFKVDEQSAAWGHLHWPWIGEVRSGELTRPPR